MRTVSPAKSSPRLADYGSGRARETVAAGADGGLRSQQESGASLAALRLERGVFTLSFDFELIWGTLDLFGPEVFRRRCEREREFLIERLLRLLDEFGIPATWFVVGHLFLDECGLRDGHKHRSIVRPTHKWARGDWFAHDPGGTETDAPTFLARSLVERIAERSVGHEIGCHSFSHVIFGDAGCSRETAESELAACVALADDMGLELRSFAFPRNKVGHLDVLRQFGFTCYRGPESKRQESGAWAELLARATHIWDVLSMTEPDVVLPEIDGGIWNVPGSMVFFPAHGPRRLIPVCFRVKRALKGLTAAVRERRVFHLWMHPTNLVDRMGSMLGGLRAVLRHAAQLRDQGLIDVARVGDLAGSNDRTVGSAHRRAASDFGDRA